MINIVPASMKDFRLDNLGQTLNRKSLRTEMKAVIPSRELYCSRERGREELLQREAEVGSAQVESRLPAFR